MEKIMLVLPPVDVWAEDFFNPDFGYAHGFISLLNQISNLTVLIPIDVDVRKYYAYLKKNLGPNLRVISLADMDRNETCPRDARLLDYKPFVNQSLEIYEYIDRSFYDCVIFDVSGAAGFIPFRAKRTGLGLEKTLLVSWLRSCHEFQRRQVLETPVYPHNFSADLELDFAERYCCQHCDLIVTHTDTILKWVIERDWKFDRRTIVPLSDLKTSRSLKPLLEKLPTVDPSQLNVGRQPEATSPLLSICIAHFNDGRNLRYLLKSVKENDYKNFEVIVVDDGSTDAESLEIFGSLAFEYGSDSWRFITKSENQSLGPTRNFAVNHASGEFIFFLDSDDLVAETLISDFVRGMQNSRADCLTSTLVFFEGDGGSCDNANILKYWIPLGACVELGIYENPFGAANFCIKKSVFEALGGFCGPRGEVHEDWEFLARLVLAGYDMDVLPKALYFYRIRPGSWLQTARSSNSVQKLRGRILDNTGPQHIQHVHDLFLLTMGENDRLKASAWQLDRKIVKTALKLADEFNERNRTIIKKVKIHIYEKCKTFLSNLGRFLPVTGFMRLLKNDEKENILNSLECEIDVSRFFVRPLLESQLAKQTTDLGLPTDRPAFGFIGEMDREKSIIGFLRLAYWMQMSKDDSFFILLGNRQFKNGITAMATKYNLRNFKWIPFLEKPEDLYAILSGFVITSEIGETHIEIFEALACGVPVFATDVKLARRLLGKYGSGAVVAHDPQYKDFADCFMFWKNHLEIYKTAAIETAELIQRNLVV
jgi:glycosyltransferase involved in cell wall biosynthesis